MLHMIRIIVLADVSALDKNRRTIYAPDAQYKIHHTYYATIVEGRHPS